MTLSMAGVFFVFFVVVFVCYWTWIRLVGRASRPKAMATGHEVWSLSMIGGLVVCLLFALCFALGVWFSLARLKGDGWILSA